MRDVNNGNFGLLIAYLIPGAVALGGLSFVSAIVESWFRTSATLPINLGGMFFCILGGLGFGVFINLVRYLTIDRIHKLTGIKTVALDYSVLQKHVSAIDFLVRNQFRYHQFYGNMLIGISVCLGLAWSKQQLQSIGVFVAFAVTETILFLGSRICFRNYYYRLAEILQNEKKSKSILWISPTATKG